MMDELMRLRELRDNLAWFTDTYAETGSFRGYRVQLESTERLVVTQIERLLRDE